MFLSTCVTVSLGRKLVQWTIIDIEREDRTFHTLFMEVKAGKFDCIQVIDDLKHATLLQVLVGKDKDNLMVTSARQSVSSVCEEFGSTSSLLLKWEDNTPLTSHQLMSLATSQAKTWEKLYYSCGYELICVHCASEEVTDSVDSDFLPQCQECEHMERICRPKKKT